MIGIENDAGGIVHAVGAPGSVASVQVQYPQLISRLRGQPDAEARQILCEQGAFSPLETQSLLEAAKLAVAEELTGRVPKR